MKVNFPENPENYDRQSCELLKTSKWVQGKAVVGDQKILSHLDLISV
jgi:hypothetical protein